MANYTLNYTGEKVDELLNKIDTAFGETTVTTDAITWDGNTEGLDSVSGYFYRVSGVVPALEELQQGGSVVMHADGADMPIPFDSDAVTRAEDAEMGTNVIIVAEMVMVALADGAELILEDTITFPKAGIYFIAEDGNYISALTVNNYTFETTKIKTIDAKYIPVDYIKQLIAEVTG